MQLTQELNSAAQSQDLSQTPPEQEMPAGFWAPCPRNYCPPAGVPETEEQGEADMRLYEAFGFPVNKPL